MILIIWTHFSYRFDYFHSRYLLIGLGVNPDPLDAVLKTRHIIAVIPKPWIAQSLFKTELSRFASFLTNTLGQIQGLGREAVQDLVNLLKYLGFEDESETLRRRRIP